MPSSSMGSPRPQLLLPWRKRQLEVRSRVQNTLSRECVTGIKHSITVAKFMGKSPESATTQDTEVMSLACFVGIHFIFINLGEN